MLFLFLILQKKQRNNHSSASYWWEYTKSCFKENAKIFSKNSTTQEHVAIRKNLLFLLKTHENNHFSESDWWRNTKSSFKEMLEFFLKIPRLKKIIKFSEWKEDCKTYTKKKTSNQKFNRWLITYKMNFRKQTIKRYYTLC